MVLAGRPRPHGEHVSSSCFAFGSLEELPVLKRIKRFLCSAWARCSGHRQSLSEHPAENLRCGRLCCDL